MKAALFRSNERYEAFHSKLKGDGIEVVELDFSQHDWLNYDYNQIDILIYYSSFKYTSNHPLALQEVYDNLAYIYSEYPHLCMFPDPNGFRYYNDKYRQFLFLNKHDFPMPETIPLFSMEAVEAAERKLGYPMVIKNRYGAGGGSVFRAFSRNDLIKYYNLSTLNIFNMGAAKYFFSMFRSRIFLYWLVKKKRCQYPFLSYPLLAQKFVKIDRDLKTVVGDGQIIEAHWRHQAHDQQWKVNIDDGGIGVWSYVPDKAINMSLKLARMLDTRWLNLDLLFSNNDFLITEFSPVWHHYAYKEKPSFVYKDDYNIQTPLEISLDLEKILVESMVKAVKMRQDEN